MIEGLKVSNKWGPISGSPIVNVSRVRPLTHVRNRVDNFAGSNPPGSYLFLKLWNDLQNMLEVRGVAKVLFTDFPEALEVARLSSHFCTFWKSFALLTSKGKAQA